MSIGPNPPNRKSAPSEVPGGESRRAELLRVAIDVFGDQGFAGARIDEIARRVGIRRPSVLYHFADKASLYHAAISAVVDEVTERVLATGLEPGDQLEAIADTWIDFVIARPLAARLLLRQMIDAGPLSTAQTPTGPSLQRLLATIQHAIDERSPDEVASNAKAIDAPEFALILSSASLVWVAGQSAVQDALGLDTLSPDAIQRHRQMLRALVTQLVAASEVSADQAPRSAQSSRLTPARPSLLPVAPSS